MKKFVSTVLTAALVAGAALAPAFTSNAAGSWQNDGTGWWYDNGDGTYAASEWIEGYWLDDDGYQRYEPVASWYNDTIGWWYQDTSGYYPAGVQEKIDHVVYQFNGAGYMEVTGWNWTTGGWYYKFADGTYAESEWVDGYWVSGNQYWTYEPRASWYQDEKGWYYMDTSGYYEKSCQVKIDGVLYEFDDQGYLVEFTKITPKSGATATVNFAVPASGRNAAARDMNTLLGSITADGATKKVLVDGVEKTITNKAGTIYVDNETLQQYVSKVESTKTDVELTFDADAQKVFDGVKIAGTAGYSYQIKFGGVTFKNISTKTGEVSFTANGAEYKGDVVNGSLLVKTDVTTHAWVKSLKDAGVIESSTPVVDHK